MKRKGKKRKTEQNTPPSKQLPVLGHSPSVYIHILQNLLPAQPSLPPSLLRTFIHTIRLLTGGLRVILAFERKHPGSP